MIEQPNDVLATNSRCIIIGLYNFCPRQKNARLVHRVTALPGVYMNIEDIGN